MSLRVYNFTACIYQSNSKVLTTSNMSHLLSVQYPVIFLLLVNLQSRVEAGKMVKALTILHEDLDLLSYTYITAHSLLL